jgi:hypothetical protein
MNSITQQNRSFPLVTRTRVLIFTCLLLTCLSGIIFSIHAGSNPRPSEVMARCQLSAPPKHPPTMSSPSDISYAAGDPGDNNTITWTVNGSYTSWTWNILSNGSPSLSGSSTTIIKNVTLAVGNYSPCSVNFTLVAINMDGNASDSVIMTVFPSVAPVLSSPQDLSYPSGQAGNQISWTPTDAHTGMRTYTIYCNGTVMDTGQWTSDAVITISLAGLPTGSYNYTIVVDDGIGGISYDEVIVIVRAGTPAVDVTIWVIMIIFGFMSAFVVFKAMKEVGMPIKPRRP